MKDKICKLPAIGHFFDLVTSIRLYYEVRRSVLVIQDTPSVRRFCVTSTPSSLPCTLTGDDVQSETLCRRYRSDILKLLLI